MKHILALLLVLLVGCILPEVEDEEEQEEEVQYGTLVILNDNNSSAMNKLDLYVDGVYWGALNYNEYFEETVEVGAYTISYFYTVYGVGVQPQTFEYDPEVVTVTTDGLLWYFT